MANFIVTFFKSRYEFFNELYHRFLLTPKVNMKCLCLQALAIVYGRCHEEIGPFTDTRYIIGMLERVRSHLWNLLFDSVIVVHVCIFKITFKFYLIALLP